LREPDPRARRFGLRAHRRPGEREAEGRPARARAGGHPRRGARRRPDRNDSDEGARQRRVDRGTQGHHGAGLVRGAAVRHGGRLQALRGELPWAGTPAPHPGGGPIIHRQSAVGSRGMTKTATRPAPLRTRERKAMEKPLTREELERMNAYWRACNYLSVGMIYLKDNPLLKEPLKPEHIKHRLLGHWGASP